MSIRLDILLLDKLQNEHESPPSTFFNIRLKGYIFIAKDPPRSRFKRAQNHEPNDFENTFWRSKSEDLPSGSFGQRYDVTFGIEDSHLDSDGEYTKYAFANGDSSTRVLVMAARKTTKIRHL